MLWKFINNIFIWSVKIWSFNYPSTTSEQTLTSIREQLSILSIIGRLQRQSQQRKRPKHKRKQSKRPNSAVSAFVRESVSGAVSSVLNYVLHWAKNSEKEAHAFIRAIVVASCAGKNGDVEGREQSVIWDFGEKSSFFPNLLW